MTSIINNSALPHVKNHNYRKYETLANSELLLGIYFNKF